MKKWAFVADVARLDIIYRFGGIYLDTDVEILKPGIFDGLLDNSVIMAFENARSINSGLIFAAEKELDFTKKMLDCYNDEQLLKRSYITNVSLNRPVIKKYYPQISWDEKSQKINDLYLIGTEEYDTLMRHHATGTWLPAGLNYKPKKDSFIKKKLKIFLRNPKIFEKLEKSTAGKKLVRVYTLLAYDILDMELMYFIKLQIVKKRNKK